MRMKRAQTTLAGTGFEKYTKTTRRAQFLAEMDRVVPWRALCARIEPVYPLLQRLLSLILQVIGAVAERERLKKGDDNRFLLGGQCPEAGRIPIRRA
jgi:hypothetical protein